MSSQTDALSIDEIALSLIPLLKEYTRKLKGNCQKAHKFWQDANPIHIGDAKLTESAIRVLRAEYKALREQVQRLKPPSNSLASHVSQLLEHGAVEGVLRLELMLRLAEFEGALHAVDAILATIPATLLV